MSIQEAGTVSSGRQLAEGLYELWINMPAVAAKACPGQFVHISCGEGNLLRRPISICDVDAQRVCVVFQVKGEGTKWLAGRKTGDTIDLLGPLGHGFDLSALGERPAFIGGGIGVPPMLYAMKQARARGAEPSAILGFRTRRLVILEHEFASLGALYLATDDGTYGTHGLVSDVLRDNLGAFTGVAACGPKPMLKALAHQVRQAGLPCQVSLEERMGCGIGACLVCACELKLRDGKEGVRYGHVCKDGPVFDAGEVIW